jgi:hypothetical protein
MQHLPTIRDQDQIITAAGAGKVPFVSAGDIAAIAYRALTDQVPHNTDRLILGPELLSYDQVSLPLSLSQSQTLKRPTSGSGHSDQGSWSKNHTPDNH